MDIKTWLKPIRIILLVLLIISLSGCLGSTSELDLQNMSEEEIESRADALQQGAVEHPHFLNGGVTTTRFEGVEQIKPDYVRIRRSDPILRFSAYNGTPDGNNQQIRSYSLRIYSTVIEFYMGNRTDNINRTDSIENVTLTTGETYNVSLPNRSRWRYQDYMDEGREIALSQIESVEAKSDDDLAIHLDPSKGLVTEYINKQYNSLVGERELNLSPSNFESANATLMLDLKRNKSGQITLSINGMSELNVSLVGENKSVSSDFVVIDSLQEDRH